jgi:tetratricopeptide (TPR) repeat protein
MSFLDGGSMDYRQRSFDPRTTAGVALVDRNHIEPARRQYQENPKDLSILDNLDFTLRYVPNHLQALRQLIAYSNSGGNFVGFHPLDCYFLWAREFTPDDSAVLVLEAVYRWKAGQSSAAERLFQSALSVDTESVEIHYVSGLFYSAQKRYGKALEYALFAYDHGYPLPGLRNELIRAGQWPKEAPLQQPAGATAPAKH